MFVDFFNSLNSLVCSVCSTPLSPPFSVDSPSPQYFQLTDNISGRCLQTHLAMNGLTRTGSGRNIQLHEAKPGLFPSLTQDLYFHIFYLIPRGKQYSQNYSQVWKTEHTPLLFAQPALQKFRFSSPIDLKSSKNPLPVHQMLNQSCLSATLESPT